MNRRIEIDRFDRAVIVFAITVLVGIGVVAARGDQVGVGVVKFGPQQPASARPVISVTFDDVLDPASVTDALSIDPPVVGKASVNERTLTFQPDEPLHQGQTYTVTLREGVRSQNGRALKQATQWTFMVRQPRLLYLGPADSVVQNLYMVDPAHPETVIPVTNSPPEKGILGYDPLPDGSKVVYSEFQGQGASSLFVWDSTTRTSSLLYKCDDAACTNPVWRPDGGAVAFERSDLNTGMGVPPGLPRVWIFDLASNSASRLFDDGQRVAFMPRWSPDGSKLAVYDSTSGGIAIHDFATGKDGFVKTPQGEVGAFSPDGNWIYFPKIVSLPDKRVVAHIVLVNISKEPYVQHDLAGDTDPNNDVEVAWRADSRGLIVARRPAAAVSTQGPHLYNIDATTNAATPLLVDPTTSQSNLSVSPGGSTLAFQRFTIGKAGAHPEVWIMDLQTNQPTLMAANGMVPRWLP